uniref:Uncharacterized protein n=1 Tax=Anguilla anguilla TaxID=7936 RepID=A0A0E9SB57_ANGAN
MRGRLGHKSYYH